MSDRLLTTEQMIGRPVVLSDKMEMSQPQARELVQIVIYELDQESSFLLLDSCFHGNDDSRSVIIKMSLIQNTNSPIFPIIDPTFEIILQ